VTEPGSVLLDRAQLERAFTAIGERSCAAAASAQDHGYKRDSRSV
jgi:hypothetical protein